MNGGIDEGGNECVMKSSGDIDDTVTTEQMRKRYPYCIVWTPIPFLTWLCPAIGHMGIAMSSGVIRDFAGPYFVSEDNMAFGWPTKFWQLDPTFAIGGSEGWDHAVIEASNEYSTRMHNLCCDNCHSHVAMALNIMKYDSSSRWNMVKLALLMLLKGQYVSCGGILRTWLPFVVMVTAAFLIAVVI
ncbi:transmembrane protein 222 [Anabrus simplex]|uniref:transmembrane protein 222 n=1 Tax=Anabrus simplex TaxID=316456 RepID=UPI0035A3D609